MKGAHDLTAPISALPSFFAANYQPHRLHAEECLWVEKNCYIDIWIELLHALGCEPLAAMGFTAAIDFEGDNWTFFKPPHEDLKMLFGVDVQELNVWRPLIDHAAEYLAAGKFISTEANSFWLPDTVGTDYRTNHVKTTIVLVELDVKQRRLGYFHNAGFHYLDGEDFAQTFALDRSADSSSLPLFAEIVRSDRLTRHAPDDLKKVALNLLRKHVARRPLDNPVRRFQARFESDLPWLQEQGLATYHAWAFATLRQLGAASELLSHHLSWLDEQKFAAAANDFAMISAIAKTFILKAARAVNSKKPLDSSPLFDEMSAAWQNGMDNLEKALDS